MSLEEASVRVDESKTMCLSQGIFVFLGLVSQRRAVTSKEEVAS
jgi:hypothetical protein